jgi:hypothetical protein
MRMDEVDESGNSVVDIELKMKLKLAEIEKRKEAREENLQKVCLILKLS